MCLAFQHNVVNNSDLQNYLLDH